MFATARTKSATAASPATEMIPLVTAMQLSVLVLAAAVHQNPAMLRPVFALFGLR
jgi:hypothetical protein